MSQAMRWIHALLLAALPLTVQAGPPLPIVPMIGTDAEPFDGYDEACGFPILETPLPQMARAMQDTRGTPVIVLDPVLRQPGHAARRVFLIAHECAHHRLEHTDEAKIRVRAGDPDVVRDQELSADCWAAETLMAAGEERVLRLMMDDFFRQGAAPPGLGYPSGLQRSRLILRCAGLG